MKLSNQGLEIWNWGLGFVRQVGFIEENLSLEEELELIKFRKKSGDMGERKK